jgi:O-antigen/teichoic acid export membrane protein
LKKIFLSTLLLQLSLNLIVKPLYVFGIDRGVQNAIGKEAYGIYFSLFSFSYLLQMLNDFGIQNFTSSTVAKHPHLVQKYFSNLFVFKLILSSIYVVLTLGGAWLIGYGWQEIKLLCLVMLIQIVSSFLLFFRANILALGDFKTDSFLSVLDRILLLLLGSACLYFGFFQAGSSAYWFVMIQITAFSSVALIAFYLLQKQIGRVQLSYNPAFLRYLLKKGFGFALIAFLMFIYNRADAVLIERMLPDGKAEAGVFASAYRLLEAANSVMLIFGTLLLPIFSGMVGRKENINELLQLSIKIVLFISITASVLIFNFRIEIVNLLYHEANNYWADTMGILFLSYIPLAMSYVLGSLLTASGQLKQYNLLSFVGVVFSLTANFLLIPYYKALGAAIVSVGTQSLIVVGLLYANTKFYQLKTNWLLLFKIGFFSLILYLLVQYTNDFSTIWYIKFLLLGSFAFLLSFIMDFWNTKEIFKLLKKS